MGRSLEQFALNLLVFRHCEEGALSSEAISNTMDEIASARTRAPRNDGNYLSTHLFGITEKL
jgi:hypothetical protein